ATEKPSEIIPGPRAWGARPDSPHRLLNDAHDEMRGGDGRTFARARPHHPSTAAARLIRSQSWSMSQWRLFRDVPSNELIGDVVEIVANNMWLGPDSQHIVPDPPNESGFPSG